jgi:hypothetical protein
MLSHGYTSILCFLGFVSFEIFSAEIQCYEVRCNIQANYAENWGTCLRKKGIAIQYSLPSLRKNVDPKLQTLPLLRRQHTPSRKSDSSHGMQKINP